MLIRVDQFHGARPRREPRLLGPYEAQEASNCRLWSGACDSWRRPAAVLDVGTNCIIQSNDFANIAWTQTALAGVTQNAIAGPDSSTTADKIRESTASSIHSVKQSAAKTAVSEFWTGAVSVLAGERTFAFVQVGDGLGVNYAVCIVNLATGVKTLEQLFGNFVGLIATVVAESGGFYRVHVTVKTNAVTAVQLVHGPALNGTTFVYAGTTNSGAYFYGASLRRSARIGAYRETTTIALPGISSIYLYKNLYWFVTAARANFVKGPIAGDTTDAIYFTGGQAPHPSVTYDPIAYAGGTGRGDMPRQQFTCGLPAPVTPPVPTVQPQTGNVTNVTNVLTTMANQTVDTFTTGSFASDGYDLVPSCRFKVSISTSTATSLIVTVRITRAGNVVAEAERRVNLNYTAGVTVNEVVEIVLSARDPAPAASHTYTYTMVVTSAAGAFTPTYDHREIAVRYAKAKITTGSHPFRIGEHITVESVGGFEDVNQKNLPVVAVGATDVSVDLVSTQTYTSGGTWKKDYLDEELQDTGWVVTFLTQVGNHVQEGPPSPISALVAIGSGQPVSLASIPTTPPGDGGVYNLTGKRLYRSNVDSNEDANFQFVADLALGDATYTDSKRFVELGEILPSEEWIRPPTDLTELTALHNGMLAGISKNQVCFSQPFQPQAWPTAYRISINFQPVALASYSESLLVMTAGKPTIVIGFDPTTMRPVPTELAQPCLSITGAVDMGDYVAYPGDDGLVLVSTARAGVITQALFTKEEWQALNPSSFVASEYDGRYVCFYTPASGIGAGFVLDPREPMASFTTLDFYASVAWTDPKSGDLYLVVDEQIVKWDAHPSLRFRKLWHSKRYATEHAMCPAFGKVIADAYPVDFSLFANSDAGNPNSIERVCSRTVENGKPFILPSGYLATAFELEVQGLPKVTEVAVASSIAEFEKGR